MENKQIIQIIKDLISTPEHSDKHYKIISKGNELVEMLEAEQLTICGVSKSFYCYKEEVKGYRCESCCNTEGKCFWNKEQ